MTILQIMQGNYRDLSGQQFSDTVEMLTEHDAQSAVEHPTWYPNPCWRVIEARENQTAAWGTEWYSVDAEGLLQRHSAFYDSSG